MKKSERRWLWGLSGGLLATSVVLYVLQIAIFRSTRDTFFHGFGEDVSPQREAVTQYVRGKQDDRTFIQA